MEENLKIPNHVAIILDGNGRWAKAKGMPRNYGHVQGAKTVEVICEEAYRMGIQYLTVYAFSTENWNRPQDEVDALMKLLRNYMKTCLKTAEKNRMCVRVLGDKTRLDQDIQTRIAELEEATKNNDGLHFQIAINYGGRDEIIRAVKKLSAKVQSGDVSPETITADMLEDYLDTFQGILIVVSHDRYFLDRIAKRIFAFEQGNIRQYEGGYTDYLAKRPEDETAVGNAGTETSGKKADQTENADAIENTEKKDSRATWKSGRKLKFTWQEQKDYETIEDDIAALEAKLEELDEKMGSFASDFVKLNELTQEKIKVEDELEHKMERWEYLEELNARIKAQDR